MKSFKQLKYNSKQGIEFPDLPNGPDTSKLSSLVIKRRDNTVGITGQKRYANSGLFMMLLTIVTLLVITIPTRAQETGNIPSPLDQYLLQAAENNPSLRADYQNYLSGLEKVPQVKTLPDPELSFGYFISPIETRVGPQQARFGLTQMFPWFGTLNARGDVAAKMAQARFESFQEARNRLFYEVQKKWYRLYHIDQNIDILRENVSILETFESLAIRRYEAGQVGQVDVLRVQIEKEDLKTRFELMNDNRKVALKEFRELLNSDSDEHIKIADSLQSRDLVLSVPELEQRIMRQNAQLSSLDYQVSSAKSAIEAARKEGLPKFGLGMD